MMHVSKETHIRANKGECCPNKNCQSKEIEGKGFNVEGVIASQDMWCTECEVEWEAQYTLSNFKITRAPADETI